jgi:lysophospholipase L1-like esterase
MAIGNSKVLGGTGLSEIGRWTKSLFRSNKAVLDFSNVIMIGDSFLGGWNWDNTNSTNSDIHNWGTQLAGLMGITNYRRYPVGGGGFVAPGTLIHNGTTYSSVTYGQALANVIYPAEQAQASKITAVICVGGANDTIYNNARTGSTDAVLSAEKEAVAAFCTAVKQYFPAATLYLMHNPMLGMSSSANPNQNINPAVLSGFIQGAESVSANTDGTLTAKRVCFNAQSWCWLYGETDYYASDLLHPLTDGYKIIAAHMANWMLRGDAGGTYGARGNGFYSVGGGGIFLHKLGDQIIVNGYGSSLPTGNSVAVTTTMPYYLRPKNYDKLIPCGYVQGKYSPIYLWLFPNGNMNLFFPDNTSYAGTTWSLCVTINILALLDG